MDKNSKILIYLFVLLMIVLCLKTQDIEQNGIKKSTINNKKTKTKNQLTENKLSNLDIPSDYKIYINQPSDLNYKAKSEILAIRRSYVRKSIFNDENYSPSEEVFGQIVDNKPWIGLSLCMKNNGESDTIGASEESRFINNPSLLIGINYIFHFENCDTQQKQKFKYFMPKMIKYYKDKNILEIVYDQPPYNYDTTYYSFEGTNARDLGYSHIYVDKKQTNIELLFTSENNVSNSVYELKNFIHLGGSCGVEGGCNNGSPNQPELNFNYRIPNNIQNPQIYIKLWQKRPLSADSKPDITEIIKINKN